MTIHVGAGRLVASSLAASIRPKPPVPFRAWLPDNIVLVDGPMKGEAWSLEDAPYLGAIADCLSVEDPCNLVTVRKSQQTGISILAMAWVLYIAEVMPDNALYALPSGDFLKEMNSRKFEPLIKAWEKNTGKRIIEPTVSRSGTGSTTYEKKFPGGAIALANANVGTDLSGDTARFGVKDEVSKWQIHTNGDDPETLFFGRFTAFRRRKTYKLFELSTPEIDTGDPLGDEPGHCRIDRSFKRSDQRFWNIECAECGHRFKQIRKWFHLDREHPHKSFYECRGCGHCISEMERVVGVRNGLFIPSAESPDRHPGFHVDAFDSLMMSYEAIAEDMISYTRPGGLGEKGISNLLLGLPAKESGNAPDHERLMERREDYKEGVIPAEGLITTAGGDVQHNGIWCEAVTFSEDRQSWSLTAKFFEGPTDNIDVGAWPLLDAFYREPLIDVFGQPRMIEAMAVDGGDGGRTNQVLEWCRRRPDCYAIKGVGGRGVPAISSTPQKKSVTKRGKKKKFGSAMLWPVGTWGLKSEFVANMHKKGLAAGKAEDPPGYCHFGQFLGKEYFMQVTAESFTVEFKRGRLHEEWKLLRRDNHLFDCRIYAMAMAELLGLSTKKPEQWAALRAHFQPDTHAGDLFGPSTRSPQDLPARPAAPSGSSLADIAKKLNS